MAHVVLESYLVAQIITECDEFSRSHSQRALAINTVMAVLEDRRRGGYSSLAALLIMSQ